MTREEDREITEKLRTILDYVPLIVTHNKITSFEELMDAERTKYPKPFYDVLDIVFKLYNYEENQGGRISRWISDINWCKATEETTRRLLEEKGYEIMEF